MWFARTNSQISRTAPGSVNDTPTATGCDPDAGDGLEVGDVNVSYAVHPWARGRGVAVEAIRLICEFVRANDIGTRAAIRVDPENTASVRVAHKSGFTYVRDFVSSTDTHDDGTPVTLSLYLLGL
jgi:RimJ/RimL family protein N-acetyltransferase